MIGWLILGAGVLLFLAVPPWLVGKTAESLYRKLIGRRD